MGYRKERRPVLFRAGLNASTNQHTSTGAWLVDSIQSLTGTSTGTAVTNFGVTHITSTGSGGAGVKVFTLNAPIKGVHKWIIGEVTSTKSVQVRTPSSAAGSVFLGSTKNSITFTTGSTFVSPPRSVHLVGMSSVKWAVLSVDSPLARPTTALLTVAQAHRVTIEGATA